MPSRGILRRHFITACGCGIAIPAHTSGGGDLVGLRWGIHPMGNTRPKVLVVDDEAAITSTLSAILRMHGYDTATASSGEEAVEVARSFRPDCIVSEMMMKTMNGVEAAIEISRALPFARCC